MESAQCNFCAYECTIAPGETGRCGVRGNRGGTIKALYPGVVAGPQLDPVEKKPLYHYFPGQHVFSVAGYGCNFRCEFCQNHHLVTGHEKRLSVRPGSSVGDVMDMWRHSGQALVGFTYAEPGVWLDLVLETGKAVRQEGGEMLVISNGFYSPSGLESLMELSSAFNIDLKGGETFYKEYVHGSQKPVLKTIQELAKSPDHVLEVTTLVIEGVHSKEELQGVGEFLSDAGVQVWHLSLFHPAYKMQDTPATTADFVIDILNWAKSELAIPHIYLGNAAGDVHKDSFCANCGEQLIERRAHLVQTRYTNGGLCPGCGQKLYGRFGDPIAI